MSKKIPTDSFKWMKEKELENWETTPCILKVDLIYPNEYLHNDLPLAPERLIINKVEKLIPNLGDKKEYIVHYEALKQMISLALELTHIHSGISFNESNWMKPYIDLNTNLRMKADNDFEKDFFKLMNNSVFGKTMEDIRKRVDIKLVTSEKLAKKWINRPNFKGRRIF